MTAPAGLPLPPFPPNLDLRHLPYMPFVVRAFLASRLFRVGTAEEIGAAFLLWAIAWWEIPPCSVPGDERELMAMTKFSGNPDGWARVRGMALSHFEEHADGRLYHSFLVQEANRVLGHGEESRGRAQRAAHERWKRHRGAVEANPTNIVYTEANPIENAHASDSYAHASDSDAQAMHMHAKTMPNESKSKSKSKSKSESTRLVAPSEPRNQAGRVGQIRASAREGVDSPPVDLGHAPEPHREPHLAVQAWNALADELGRPKVQTLISDSRRRSLAARLRECAGLPGWDIALAKVRDSPFLSGRTEHNFRVTFDWVTKQANFTKIMEGNYDEKRNGAGSHRSDRLRGIFEEAGRIYEDERPRGSAQGSSGSGPGDPGKLPKA